MIQKIKNPTCDNCQQSNCFINKFCSRKWKTSLAEHKSFGAYKRNQHIFAEGNIVFGVFFIYSGKVKVFSTGKDDRKQIVRLASSGEMLGLRGMAEKKYLVSGTAMEDSSLCFFHKDIFLKSIKENPDLALQIIQFYAQELCNLQLRQKAFTRFSMKERVAEALLMIKEKYGVKIAGETFLLDVRFTLLDLADLVGSSYEMVIRTMTLLKKEGLVKIQKGKIILNDCERLQKLLSKHVIPEYA